MAIVLGLKVAWKYFTALPAVVRTKVYLHKMWKITHFQHKMVIKEPKNLMKDE